MINTLVLDSIKGKKLKYTPVWAMRQVRNTPSNNLGWQIS
jgi:uroporphyrinogen-III decarboxylase